MADYDWEGGQAFNKGYRAASPRMYSIQSMTSTPSPTRMDSAPLSWAGLAALLHFGDGDGLQATISLARLRRFGCVLCAYFRAEVSLRRGRGPHREADSPPMR